jgi:hypothetical protein
MNILMIAGNEIPLNPLDNLTDAAFADLYASYFSNQVLIWDSFVIAAYQFFDRNPISNPPTVHDAYFNNFIPIWERFYTDGNFDKAEHVWFRALEPAFKWEKINPNTRIHKGAAYYFWAMTALQRGDLDKCYALMHCSVQEDILTLGGGIPKTAGYAFVSLDFSNPNQALYDWVRGQMIYLNERQNRYSEKYERPFTLEDFRKKFLCAPPRAEIAFLFTYSIARLMKISSIPTYALQSGFSAQIIANLFFDITLVIDAAIKSKHNKEKFIDLAEFLLDYVKNPLKLGEVNNAFKNNLGETLTLILNNTFSLPGNIPLSNFQSDVAIAYGLRNCGAHNISSVEPIGKRFLEIEQALLNVLFAVVDHLY